MRFAYYNENDPYAAQWLRNLIAAGEIPAGDVDDRDFQEVTPDDLKKYTQCHFFAGIGGWPYALNLAGWPEERPVWTGSCPCQPLSSAGQRKGHADQRHLWPAFYRLIAECRPTTVFGEQVASKDGREWFSAVRADMEATGYACGCANLAAASVGAPHIRQRLFWVADAESEGPSHGRGREARFRIQSKPCKTDGANDRLADAESGEAHSTAAGGLHAEPGDGSGMGDPDDQGSQRRRIGSIEHADQCTPWSSSEFIECADGKTRITQPGIRPLAHGIQNRVGRLRAYGNAIVPQVAEAFIRAYTVD